MNLLQFLNDVFVEHILPMLTTPDLLAMSKSCAEATAFVDSYRMRSHCKPPQVVVLLQFFDAVGPSHAFPLVQESVLQRFSHMLGRTGAVASGSAVLSMLTRALYENQDLDLFVPVQSVDAVREFVLAEGYKFAGEVWRQNDYNDVADINSVTEWLSVRGGVDRKVQIISCLCSPMHTVLAFHSTVVANVLTSTHLICLYAQQTIHSSVNIPMEADDESGCRALIKYSGRGFEDQMAYKVLSGQSGRPRAVGDTYCWEMRHSPGKPCNLRSHTWVDKLSTYNLRVEACTIKLSGTSFLMEPVLFDVFNVAIRDSCAFDGADALREVLSYVRAHAGTVWEEHRHGYDCQSSCALRVAVEALLDDVQRMLRVGA